MTAEKVRENKLRRLAERRGFRVLKSRRRDPGAYDYGGYMVVEIPGNYVVFGGHPYAYAATVDEVEGFLSDPPKRTRKNKSDRKRAVTRKRSSASKQR